MITERTEFGKIEILADGQIQLREDTVIERDGVEISRLYHRRVLEPSETHTETNPRVRTAISAFWTPDVIEEFKRKKAQRERETLTALGANTPVVETPVTPVEE